VYWDGTLSDTLNSAVPASGQVHLGERWNGDDQGFMDGLIDNVYMTNEVIDDTVIALLLNGGGMPSPPPASVSLPPVPTAMWAFDFEGSAPASNAGSLGGTMTFHSLNQVVSPNMGSDARFGTGALDFCNTNDQCQGTYASWFLSEGGGDSITRNTWSLCWFVKPRNWNNVDSHPYLVDWRDSDGSWNNGYGGYWHSSSNGGGSTLGSCASCSPTSTNVGIPSAGVWHHVCVVSDGSAGTTKTYWDARLFDTMSSAVPASGNVHLGKRWNTESPMSGLIDNVYMTNEAITATQVRALFRGAGFGA